MLLPLFLLILQTHSNPTIMDKLKKKYILILALTIICTVAPGGCIYFNLYTANQKIAQKADHALLSALYTDFYQRLLAGGIHTNQTKNVPKKRIKTYRTMTERGDTTYVFEDSIDIDTAKFIIKQHHMAYYKPIHPDKLNDLFQDELAKNDIGGESGIVYIYKGKATYSNNDSISPSKATYCTPLQYIDYPPSIQIQAWADYGILSVWNHLNAFLSLLIALCLIGIAALGRWFYKLHKACKIKAKLNSRIQCDEIKQTCTIEGTVYSLVPQDLKLLKMFIQAEKQYLSRETIKQAFWKNSSYESANSNLNTHINRLRQILKLHEGYDLITHKGKGYTLVMPE